MSSIYQSGDVVTLFVVCSNTARPVTEELDLILVDVNIHVRVGSVFYGEGTMVQAAAQNTAGAICTRATTDSVVFYNQPIKISKLFFRNYISGTNAVVTITGVVK